MTTPNPSDLERGLEEEAVRNHRAATRSFLTEAAAEIAALRKTGVKLRANELIAMERAFAAEARALKAEAQVAMAVEGLEKIARDGYGLQGLTEDGASDLEIAAYWKGASDRRRQASELLSSLREGRGAALVSTDMTAQEPHRFTRRQPNKGVP